MKLQVIRFAALAASGLLLASCGSYDAEYQEFAKSKKMSAVQTAAFMACAEGHRKNKPSFPAKDGTVVMKSVPLDICACQTPAITSVLVEKEFKAYLPFAEYMAKTVKKKPPRFGKKILKDGVKSPDAGKRLANSFNACVEDYKGKNKDNPETAALFEFVPAPPPKEKKTADASH
jgi:hypothetical protein